MPPPRTILTTFSTLTINDMCAILSTPDSKALLNVKKICHVALDMTTKSPVITITDLVNDVGTITYTTRAAAEADFTKLVTLLNKDA